MDYLEKLCFMWAVAYVVILILNCCMPRNSGAEKACYTMHRILNSVFVLATVIYVWWLR